MKRGEIVLVAVKGEYGKARPALVIQNSKFENDLASCTLLLITSELTSDSYFRIQVEPSPENGLQSRSDIQIDKIVTVPWDKIRGPIGSLDLEIMRQVDRALIVHLDIRGYGVE